GLPIQLSVTCDDLCPKYARALIDFSEKLSEFECACMGFQAERGPGWNVYVGCAPPRATAAQRDFHVVQEGKSEIRVFGGTIGSRLIALGLPQGATVVAIDGAKVQTTSGLEQVLDRIPEHLPGVVGIRDVGMFEYTSELRYLTLPAITSLSNLFAELGL